MKRLIGIIFALAALSHAGTALAATANVSFSGPAEVTAGSVFQVTVSARGLVSADTVRLNGTYSKDLISWDFAQPQGAFPNVSPGTYTDVAKGTFSFGAFSLAGGTSGSSRLAALTFRAVNPGTATISLNSSSRVLSAGVDQGGAFGSITIKIVGKAVPPTVPIPPTHVGVLAVTSTSHPDPNIWYPSGDVSISWSTDGNTPIATYIGFDQSPAGPANRKVTVTNAQFTAPTDGVWYAHVMVTYKDGTSDRVDFPVRVDRQVPHAIQPVVDQTLVGPSIPNAVYFATTDDTSGIRNYIITIDGAFVTSTQATSFDLTGQATGTHVIKVEAFDRAGNSVVGQTSYEVIGNAQVQVVIPSLWTGFSDFWISYGRIIISVLAMIIAISSTWFLLVYRRRKKKKTRSRK